MNAPLYSTDILRLATANPHHGRLLAPHGSGEARSPVCGSRVTVDVEIDGDGRITALATEVQACTFGQASVSLFAQHGIGRTLADIESARDALGGFLSGDRQDPGDWPGLSVFDRVRPHSARHPAVLLSFDAAIVALREALER